jgi:hypothetical protein
MGGFRIKSRWPDNANEGNANSDILISQNIIVSGTFQAGSLYIETPMVTIPGFKVLHSNTMGVVMFTLPVLVTVNVLISTFDSG